MGHPEISTLLLDFGGVCLLNPVEMHRTAEERLGLPSGTFTWLGPLDPSTDQLWADMVAGRGITEREYWAQRAADVGSAAGIELTLSEYIDMLFDPPTPEMVRPEATATVEAAKAAGYGVSLLTNDMRAFHGSEWERRVDFLGLMDHIVDCSDTNILKPDPQAFARAEQIVGVSAQHMLFVDDQPRNIEGAKVAGMQTVWLDIANASDSWSEVARRLSVEVVNGP